MTSPIRLRSKVIAAAAGIVFGFGLGAGTAAADPVDTGGSSTVAESVQPDAAPVESTSTVTEVDGAVVDGAVPAPEPPAADVSTVDLVVVDHAISVPVPVLPEVATSEVLADGAVDGADRDEPAPSEPWSATEDPMPTGSLLGTFDRTVSSVPAAITTPVMTAAPPPEAIIPMPAAPQSAQADGGFFGLPGSGGSSNLDLGAALAWFGRRLDSQFDNDAPTAGLSGSQVTTGQQVTGAVTVTDPEQDPLTYRVSQGPQHGTATVNAQGQYVYTANPNGAGAGQPDSFVVTATDRPGFGFTGLLSFLNPPSKSTTVTVTVTVPGESVTVNPQGDPHLSSPDASGAVTGAASGLFLGAVTAYGSDAPGMVIDPQTGAFAYTPTWTLRHAAAVPNAPAITDVQLYAVDGTGHRIASTVTVPIASVNEVPEPALNPTTPPVRSNTAGTVMGTVAGLAIDADGDTLTYSLADGQDIGGRVEVRPDGSYAYVPTSQEWAAAIGDPAVAPMMRVAAMSAPTATFYVKADDGHGGTTLIPVTVDLNQAYTTDTPLPPGAWQATGPDGTTVTVEGDRTSSPGLVFDATMHVLHPDGRVTDVPITEGAYIASRVGANGTVVVATAVAPTTESPYGQSIAVIIAPDGSSHSVEGFGGAIGPDGTVAMVVVDYAAMKLVPVLARSDGTLVTLPNGTLIGLPSGLLAASFGADGTYYAVQQITDPTTQVTSTNLVTVAPDNTLTARALPSMPTTAPTVTPTGEVAYLDAVGFTVVPRSGEAITVPMSNGVPTTVFDTDTVGAVGTDADGNVVVALVRPDGTVRIEHLETAGHRYQLAASGSAAVLTYSGSDFTVTVIPADGPIVSQELSYDAVSVVRSASGGYLVTAFDLGPGGNGTAPSYASVIVLNLNGTVASTREFDGYPMGDPVMGPDGRITVIVMDSAAVGPEHPRPDFYAQILGPDGTATTVALPGQPFGLPLVGTDGTVFLTSVVPNSSDPQNGTTTVTTVTPEGYAATRTSAGVPTGGLPSMQGNSYSVTTGESVDTDGDGAVDSRGNFVRHTIIGAGWEPTWASNAG